MIEKKLEVCSNILWQCREAAAANWGLRPEVMKWIYTAVVRPVLTYAAVVWVPFCKTDFGSKRLQRLNRQACLLITGAMKTTSNKALEIIAGLPPLHFYVKIMAITGCYRMKQRGSWIGKGSWLEKELNEHSLLSLQSSDLQQKTVVDNPIEFKGKLSAEDVNQNCQAEYTISLSSVVSDIGVAGGLVITDKDKVLIKEGIKFDLLVTAIQAEVAMLETAMIYCCVNQWKDVAILSRSSSLVEKLDKVYCESKLLNSCLASANILASKNGSIKAYLVCSSQGVASLTKANEEANIAMYSEAALVEPALPRGIDAIKKQVTKKFNELIEKEWNESTGNTVCKLFINSTDNKFKTSIQQFSKKQFQQVVRLITGHCWLAEHLFKIGMASSPYCIFCTAEKETVTHYLCSCPQYIESRRDVFERDLLTKDMLSCIEPHSLLRFINISKRFEEC